MNEDVVGLARGALELRDYDPEWPHRFELERSALLTAAPQLLEVEHIGSTAIPGSAAKPVIDMQASLHWPDRQQVINRLISRGYTFMPDRVYVDRIFLPRGPETRRTHHLSLIARGSDEWRVRLRFRDALRADPRLRQEYEHLKRTLVREAHDRSAYTAAKAAFVAQVLAEHP
ncbi:GrpB family protein [Nocardioides seonyuensis]|uniref:GrpB family protein n=1 Tax=Nocardioides seonyuensis TaxID=2518371 RepID=UPI00141FAB04|nr:GrpB family protein [Nocardioides seonyuensis]